MLPANPFLQLTLPRAVRALARLSGQIWSPVADARCSFAGSWPEPVRFEAAKTLAYEPVSLPFHWGRLFDQGWFRVELPRVETRGTLYLHWQDQGEGTAYVDGVPWYGFDVAHRRCALPEGTREIYIEGLCLQSAIWHPDATGLDPRGSQLSCASLCLRDDDAWAAYHDLRMLYEVALEEGKASTPWSEPKTGAIGFQPPPDIVPVLYRRLLRGIDDAVNALDRGGLPAMREVLAGTYARLSGHAGIRSVLTGHAHIDLVWLWPERASEYKALHTFSTMNRLMDVYPEFVFGYSQPASYDAVARACPPMIEQVKRRIESGRWEALGATEVESDTLMACGEALARSFLLGQKGFRRLTGNPSRVLWIPDVFGYCGSLPQIMRQTGVDYFFTTKLTWSSLHLFPYSSFVWRGIDGSEVLVHVTQENGYNQTVSAAEVRKGACAYRQADVHDEFLSPTGYGDGGGGVTEEMCERARRLGSLSGMPEVRWGRVDDFFDGLNTVRERLPRWQGELYLEYHRGVFTTHGDLKARFRECERALQTWEAARCATGGGELDEQPWRRLVFAQFHDYIPGSSIWEVYEEGLPELAAISANALACATEELGGGKDGRAALFNPLPVERIIVLADRAVRLGPLSGAPLNELPSISAPQGVRASTGGLSSAHVEAAFDTRGRIAKLVFGGQEIPMRSPLGQLVIYPDFPHGFDAWDIDRQTLALGEPVATEATATVLASGGDDAAQGLVEFRRKAGTKSEISVRYRLDAFRPVLHVEYEIDWHEEQTLLRAIFPTAYAGRAARFGAPFGSVLRGQQAGETRDEAMWEGAASRWAIVADDGESAGLAVITEAKYGFSCRDGTLGVSLLRSPRVTGQDTHHQSVIVQAIRRGSERQTYSDQGRHVIRLALGLHTGSQDFENLAPTLADTLFTPPVTYVGGAVSSGFLGIDNARTLLPCWAKPAADGNGWILRLHETFGHRGKGRLRLAGGTRALLTNLSEEPLGEESISEIAFAPYELISLRIFGA